MFEGSFVQIGRQNFERPSLEQSAAFFQSEHGERVGLLASGAAGAPNAQPADHGTGARGQNARPHDRLQRIELGLGAKEAGFANGDFIQELDHLIVAGTRVVQLAQILAQGLDLQFLQAPRAAIFQQAQSVVGLENSGCLVDQVTNLVEMWIWGSGGSNRDGAGSHALAPSARVASGDAASSPAGSSTSRTRPSPLMVAPASWALPCR